MQSHPRCLSGRGWRSSFGGLPALPRTGTKQKPVPQPAESKGASLQRQHPISLQQQHAQIHRAKAKSFPVRKQAPIAWRQKEKGLPQGHRGFLCKGAEPRPALHHTALQQTPLGQQAQDKASQHRKCTTARWGQRHPTAFPHSTPRQPTSPSLLQQHHSNQPKCQAKEQHTHPYLLGQRPGHT